ncbi:MAG: hypothetical protein IIU39_01680, partial [Ruminococcus sp.]|nr:hypothetical protein [Ruminococcus sp.]
MLLAPGYKVADTNGIAFSSESGYAAPTLTSRPTTSGNTVTYTYKINAGHVKATVTLEAETPTLSNVYIKNKTTLDNSYPESPYANNATIEMYYKQPVMAKATTDTFSTLNYYTYSDNSGSNVPGNSPYASVNNKGTGEDAKVNADLSVRPTSENGTVNYKFEVIARNAPNGVDAKEKKYTYTIQVSFNDAQKYFFKLYRLYQKCIQETEQNNTYYKSGAPIGSYNTAYTATGSYVHDGSAQYYPDYIDTSDTTGAQTKWNTFSLAYNSLKSYAKTTTIIVLTNTNYKETSSTRPMRITAKTNGTQDDWDHFYMLTSEDNSYKSGSKEDTTHGIYTMTYDGYVTKSSVRYDVYKITYYGHIKFNIWRPDSLNDVTVETSKQITGDITGAVDYKDYYVNAYNKTVGSSSFTEISEYSDHDHTWNKKKMLEINDEKTKSYLLGSSFLNVQASGSMKSAPGIDVTAPTSITIEGPIGKAGKETKTLTNDSDTFKPTKPGKYWVKYTSIFGKTASGDNNTRTAKMAIYVATDEIDVYVDMNNNAGTPFLNFKYYVNSSGDPVTAGTSGATEANLPYEMDLATGSQSVYKYTVKISKLNGDYKLAFDLNNPIIIDYISIGDRKIGQGTGGFQLKNEARLTGVVWYKADKTNLTTFDELSYGSVNKSFIACDSENSFLSGAIKSVHGTGVIADREVEYNSSNVEVYESKYAAIYSSTINTLPSNFSYNLKATAKEEFSAGGNTYYFDKWVAVKAPDEDGDVPDIASAEDYSDNPDINFNKAVEYKEDGSSNMVYIAKYKLVSSTDTTVRVVVTYNFKDYNTEDGNYVYNANKPKLNASYTKTIKVTVGNGQTYQNFAAVRAAVDTIAKNNKPIIKSNYFDYTYDDNSGTVDTENTSESQAKIVATATFSETAHPYKIVLKDGSNSTTYDGYYQQTQELTTSKSNPVWKDNNNNIIGTGSKYVARFIASGFETDDGTSSGTDCQIIKLASDSEASADHKSIVSNSYTEQYVDGTTPKLRHNFYI